MKETIKTIFVTLLVMTMVTTVFAGQNGNEYAYDQGEDGLPGEPIRDQLKDGSCLDLVETESIDIWNDENGLGDLLRLRDGTGDNCICTE